jgi:hypothetical protein
MLQQSGTGSKRYSSSDIPVSFGRRWAVVVGGELVDEQPADPSVVLGRGWRRGGHLLRGEVHR